MRFVGKAALVVGLTLATGLASVHGGYAARSGATPTLDSTIWNKLAALRSYHAESIMSSTATGQKAAMVRWSEDVNGKDYHLTVSSSSGGNQTSEMYYVHGHFYVGQGGHFVDLGDMGKQLAQPMLAMTLGYWTGLAQSGRDARYLRRVSVAGRAADRYTVKYAVIAPGAGGNVLSAASAYYTNTVDVDVATHAPLHVSGAYKGSDGKGHSYTLNTSFAVTKVGKVGSIKVPA